MKTVEKHISKKFNEGCDEYVFKMRMFKIMSLLPKLNLNFNAV